MHAQIRVWSCLVTDNFGLFTEIAVCKFLRGWWWYGLNPFLFCPLHVFLHFCFLSYGALCPRPCKAWWTIEMSIILIIIIIKMSAWHQRTWSPTSSSSSSSVSDPDSHSHPSSAAVRVSAAPSSWWRRRAACRLVASLWSSLPCCAACGTCPGVRQRRPRLKHHRSACETTTTLLRQSNDKIAAMAMNQYDHSNESNTTFRSTHPIHKNTPMTTTEHSRQHSTDYNNNTAMTRQQHWQQHSNDNNTAMTTALTTTQLWQKTALTTTQHWLQQHSNDNNTVIVLLLCLMHNHTGN